MCVCVCVCVLISSVCVCFSACVCACVYLLLVLPLQVQSGLDISPRLLEGLSLGDLSRIVGTDPDHVCAQEDQHIGTDLKTHREKQKPKHESPTKHTQR